LIEIPHSTFFSLKALTKIGIEEITSLKGSLKGSMLKLSRKCHIQWRRSEIIQRILPFLDILSVAF
jgi:hypothetical protein